MHYLVPLHPRGRSRRGSSASHIYTRLSAFEKPGIVNESLTSWKNKWLGEVESDLYGENAGEITTSLSVKVVVPFLHLKKDSNRMRDDNGSKGNRGQMTKYLESKWSTNGKQDIE
ncbi:unnamed protein product [Lactuca virosa]|uniref:Uncharacterized protein n=1 Tax=Lactuca virosa TaxID=75947 RepID=A0AAU9PTU0_9ASTR|nr:unnamed protein product [Lactuca virosa]